MSPPVQIRSSMAKIKLTKFTESGAWSDTLEYLLSDILTFSRRPVFRDRCRDFGVDTTTPLFDWLITDLEFIRPPDAIAQVVALVLGLENRAGIDTFTASMRLASAYARKLDSDPETARKLVHAAASLADDTGLGGTAIDRWVGVNEKMLRNGEWTLSDIAATAENQPESVIYELLVGDDTRLRDTKLCGHASSRLGWHSAELMQLTTANRRWRGPLALHNNHAAKQHVARTVMLPQMDEDARCVDMHMHAAIGECPIEFNGISKDYFEGSIAYAAEMYRRFERHGVPE